MDSMPHVTGGDDGGPHLDGDERPPKPKANASACDTDSVFEESSVGRSAKTVKLPDFVKIDGSLATVHDPTPAARHLTELANHLAASGHVRLTAEQLQTVVLAAHDLLKNEHYGFFGKTTTKMRLRGAVARLAIADTSKQVRWNFTKTSHISSYEQLKNVLFGEDDRGGTMLQFRYDKWSYRSFLRWVSSLFGVTKAHGRDMADIEFIEQLAKQVRAQVRVDSDSRAKEAYDYMAERKIPDSEAKQISMKQFREGNPYVQIPDGFGEIRLRAIYRVNYALRLLPQSNLDKPEQKSLQDKLKAIRRSYLSEYSGEFQRAVQEYGLKSPVEDGGADSI